MNLLQRRIDKLEAKRRGPPRIVFEPVVAVPLDGPIEHHMLGCHRAESEPTVGAAPPPQSLNEARPL